MALSTPPGSVLSPRLIAACSPKNRNPFQRFPVIALATALSER
jgi:hypothetical protein